MIALFTFIGGSVSLWINALFQFAYIALVLYYYKQGITENADSADSEVVAPEQM